MISLEAPLLQLRPPMPILDPAVWMLEGYSLLPGAFSLGVFSAGLVREKEIREGWHLVQYKEKCKEATEE